MLANAAKAMWRGSSPALTTILGYLSKHTMAEALDGLEAKGYILRDFAPGVCVRRQKCSYRTLE
jgi:DNA-binding GntR family transcriptional regulator